jgi:hypothetical protein
MKEDTRNKSAVFTRAANCSSYKPQNGLRLALSEPERTILLLRILRRKKNRGEEDKERKNRKIGGEKDEKEK